MTVTIEINIRNSRAKETLDFWSYLKVRQREIEKRPERSLTIYTLYWYNFILQDSKSSPFTPASHGNWFDLMELVYKLNFSPIQEFHQSCSIWHFWC